MNILKKPIAVVTVIGMLLLGIPATAFADSHVRTETLDLSQAVSNQENTLQGWYWNASEKILILENADFRVEGDAIVLPAGAAVEIVGTNTVDTLNGSNNASIKTETLFDEAGDLVIKGVGSLNCKGEGGSIQTTGKVTIQDVTLTTKSNRCIYAADIQFINCNIYATDYDGIIYSGAPLIEATVDSSERTAPGRIDFSKCYIEQGGYVLTKMFSPQYDDYISTFIGPGNECAKTVKIMRGTIPNVTKPAITSITTNYNKISLKWTVPKYMEGKFDVYRSTKKTSGYKKITSTNVPYFTDAKLIFNKTYYYKIKAKNVKSSVCSSVKSCKTALKKPVLKVTKVNATTKKVSWEKITGAQGYKIYRASSKHGKYELVKNVRKESITTWKSKGLKKNKAYYYKVKAYRIVKGKTIYSKTSTAVKK